MPDLLFLIASSYWGRVSQFPISKHLWQCLGSSILCLAVWYCDVKFCANLFSDIIDCQINIAPYHKHNDIAHKGYHFLTMIELKYRHITCMLLYKIFNLEVPIFWDRGMKSPQALLSTIVFIGTTNCCIASPILFDKLEW